MNPVQARRWINELRSAYKSRYSAECEEVNEAVRLVSKLLSKEDAVRAHYVSQQSLITDLQGSATGWCDFSYFECPSCCLKLDWFNEDCYCYHCGQKLSGSDFEQEVE